jgi:hypothetical protein
MRLVGSAQPCERIRMSNPPDRPKVPTAAPHASQRGRQPEAAPPNELAQDLAAFVDLPASAQEKFLDVLAPNLAETLDDRAASQSKRFARSHEADMTLLASVVRACRHILLAAVKKGLGPEEFTQELQTLLAGTTGKEAIAAALQQGYARFVPQLTQAAVFGSIAHHGKVVRKVRWRVDTIRASDLLTKIDMPIATITFEYQEGPQARTSSFQLLPEQAVELRQALDAILP